MAIETVSSVSGELVTLSEAMRDLGVWDDDDGSRVALFLTAAHGYCEGWAEATFHESATRTYATCEWPQGGWVLRHPPVTAVSSITYYDTTNTEQTLAASNYQTHLTAAGFAVVEYTATATLPSLYDRDDAVTVTYTTGWTTAANAPAEIKAAILLTVQHLFGEDDTRQLAAAKDAAMRLLAGVAAPTYA